MKSNSPIAQKGLSPTPSTAVLMAQTSGQVRVQNAVWAKPRNEKCDETQLMRSALSHPPQA